MSPGSSGSPDPEFTIVRDRMGKPRWKPDTGDVIARCAKVLWREVSRCEKEQDKAWEDLTEGEIADVALDDKELKRAERILELMLKVKRSELLQDRVDSKEISEMDPAEIQELAQEILDDTPLERQKRVAS